MTYLSIRNWQTYQHYKDRKPPWIKFYVELLDDLEIRHLPIATRLLWDQLLLLAARYENVIQNDSEAISNATSIDVESVVNGIQELLEGRWIKETSRPRRASKLLAKRYHAASTHARPRARGEAEAEAEAESSSSKGSGLSRPPIATSLPFKHELLLTQLLAAIGGDADEQTPQVLRSYATHLPEAAVAKVLESVQSANGKNRAGYAVGALKSELAERGIKR